MTSKLLCAFVVLLSACLPEEDFEAEEVEDELRGDVSVCIEPGGNTCHLNYGGPCLPTELDACGVTLWSPMACTEPAGLCVALQAGEECPGGWLDACDQ